MGSNLYIFLILFLVGCTYNDNTRLSNNRLSNIDNLISSEIEKNNIPGAVVMVGDEKNIRFI